MAPTWNLELGCTKMHVKQKKGQGFQINYVVSPILSHSLHYITNIIVIITPPPVQECPNISRHG